MQDCPKILEPGAPPAFSVAPDPALAAPGTYPQWFEGLVDQAGRPLSVFCPRCGAQLTVLGCSAGPWTGYIIHVHRCRK